MKRIYVAISAAVVLAVGLFISTGCDNSGESNFVEQYVLDGWLPLGKQISIRLTKSVDVDNFYDNAALGVGGATVTVWESLNGDTATYELREPDGGAVGTYFAPQTADTVKTGYDYAIRIEHDGHVITATTRRAPPTMRVDSARIISSTDTVSIESYADSLSPETIRYGNYYEMFYQEPAWGAGVNVIVESIEPDWYSNDDLALSGNNGPGTNSVWFWNLRTGNSFQVPPIVENFQGRYRVRAMTCDKAGYDYFFTLYAGDPRSNPQTNVSGALGLFSVYDADTAYFCLTDPEADVVYSCQR